MQLRFLFAGIKNTVIWKEFEYQTICVFINSNKEIYRKIWNENYTVVTPKIQRDFR